MHIKLSAYIFLENIYINKYALAKKLIMPTVLHGSQCNVTLRLILSTASLVWFYKSPKVEYKVYIHKE